MIGGAFFAKKVPPNPLQETLTLGGIILFLRKTMIPPIIRNS
jgi:hypothetical protein